MDNRTEVREFLTSRRARVSPEEVGLPSGTNRRVDGLRRSEVATLAGVSVEYYTRLERGAISGASPEVLNSLAKALRLNGRMDLLGANTLGRAFYKDAYDMPGQAPNIARFTFLDERAYEFYPGWASFAEITVSILRTEAGRDPHNKELHDLIGELSTRSEEFRRLWSAHNVRHHGTGFKTFHHAVVGEMTLAYEGMELEAEPGLTLTIYAAEPGSPSAERMQLLASWAASEGHESSAATSDEQRSKPRS